ncbi:MAG: recombination mediator RecR [Candidatus Komeilibacteria bacterium]
MNYLPDFVRKLVEHFDRLPGIGPKAATRLAFFVLQDQSSAQQFAADLAEASSKTIFCLQCQNLSDQTLCSICRDANRNQQQICVVAQSQDLEAVERVQNYRGTYHILHGLLNPLEGITPEALKVKELMQRIKDHQIQEIILALDPTIEGESTALYLTKIIKPAGIKITKPARGLPMGSNIEYTDEITLSSALENRKEV